MNIINLHSRKKWSFERFWETIERNLASWYYNTKTSIFNPSNKLHIRNVPRTWYDRSDRLHHAVFSMMCDLVERELGGIDNLEQDIAANKDTEGYWYEQYREMAELYRWYTSIDWEDPYTNTEEYTRMSETETVIFHENGRMERLSVGYSDEERSKIILDNQKAEEDFEKLCTENAIRVLKLRGYMWT